MTKVENVPTSLTANECRDACIVRIETKFLHQRIEQRCPSGWKQIDESHVGGETDGAIDVSGRSFRFGLSRQPTPLGPNGDIILECPRVVHARM